MSSIILLSNGRQTKKEGKTEIQKIEYHENKKRFSDETKSIFHNYLRAIIGEKMKISGHKLYVTFHLVVISGQYVKMRLPFHVSHKTPHKAQDKPHLVLRKLET